MVQTLSVRPVFVNCIILSGGGGVVYENRMGYKDLLHPLTGLVLSDNV